MPTLSGFIAVILFLIIHSTLAVPSSSSGINGIRSAVEQMLFKWTFLRPPREPKGMKTEPFARTLETDYNTPPIRVFSFYPSSPPSEESIYSNNRQKNTNNNTNTNYNSNNRILLYFHGARESVRMSLGKFQALADRLNVRLVAVEYEGYGDGRALNGDLQLVNTRNRLSVNSIFSSAQAALKHYVQLNNKNVIVYGSGFGSLVALKALQNLYLTDSAKCDAVGGLILKNPVLPLHSHHSSIQQRLRKYLWDRMLNVFWLKDVCQCETLVLSDRIDQLNAKRTELFAGNRKAEVLISHKKEALIKRMIQFVQSLPIHVPKQATGQAAQQGTQQETRENTDMNNGRIDGRVIRTIWVERHRPQGWNFTRTKRNRKKRLQKQKFKILRTDDSWKVSNVKKSRNYKNNHNNDNNDSVYFSFEEILGEH